MKASNVDVRAWMHHHHRLVLTIAGLLFLVLVLLRVFVFPETDASGNLESSALMKSLLDGLIVAIIVSAFVTASLAWLKPPVDEALSEQIVQSYEIDEVLRDAARATHEWYYNGHTARYVRSQIFPMLNRDSLAKNENKRIRAIFLDPSNSHACSYYATYRNNSRSAQLRKDSWTSDRVCADLVASVLCMVELHQANTMLDVSAGLVERVSLFRADISSTMVLVTQEDNQEPAIRYASDSHFYRCYRREMELVWAQAKQLNLGKAVARLDLDDYDSVRTILTNVGLDSSVFTEETIVAACQAAKQKDSPYVTQ